MRRYVPVGMVCLLLLLSVGCHRKNYITGYFTADEYAQQVPWAVAEYRGKMKSQYIDSMRSIEPFQVKAFVNNECHDTRRELPTFLALYPNMPVDGLLLIGIDSTKRDPRGLARRYNLTLTPTFIFERNGRELGRIEERTPRRRNMETVIWEFVK